MIDVIWTENLIKVLDYENRLYTQLYSIAESKTEIIIKGETDNLQAVVGKEQRLISELNRLNDAREQIVEQIGKKTGKSHNEVAISDIIKELPENEAERLRNVKEKLKETIYKLKIKNDLNQKLIKNALDYVDFSLNLLTEPAPQVTQYGRQGIETARKSRVVLDIKS